MNKKIYVLCILVVSFNKGVSQDPSFANTSQSLIYLNPSFAGSNGFIRNQFSYKNQWPNLFINWVTYLNTFDAYIKATNGGVSFSLLSDNQSNGLLISNVYSLSYAQYFSLMEGKLKIIPSFQAALGTKTLDKTKLNFGDYIDTRRGYEWSSPNQTPRSMRTYFDLNSGLLINFKNFYFGAAVFHINQPDDGLLGINKLPTRITLHSSYNIRVSENAVYNLFASYQEQQNFNYVYTNVNALLFKHLIFGLGYRSDYSANLNVGYRANYFVASLVYNAPKSKLSSNVASIWEIHTSLNLRTSVDKKVITNFENW